MRGLIRRAAVASDALAGAGQSLGGAPGHLYWANANNGTIAAVPLAGGTVTRLADLVDAPYGVAVIGDRIIWANQGDGTIDEAPLTGGGRPDTLIHGQDFPAGVAVDSGHIYWASTGDGVINEAPLAGGTVTTLVPESPGSPGATGVAVGP